MDINTLVKLATAVANIIASSPFKTVKSIIVHGGRSSHNDEQLFCVLARLLGANCSIERRNPTEAELADPDVLVGDVGLVYFPEQSNYDHHQCSTADDCAYSLLAKASGLWDLLIQMSPSWDIWARIDQNGPFKTARAEGLEWSAIEGFVRRPLSATYDRLWAANSGYRDFVTAEMADDLRNTILGIAEMAKTAVVTHVQDLTVLDTRAVPEAAQVASSVVSRIIGANVVVSNDDRGPGSGLLRLNDDPRVDFRKCTGKPYAGFIHKDGFVLKTTSKDADLAEVIGDAYVKA